jgi:transposase
VGHHSEAFVGIDTSTSRNAIAVADGGRGGEVRYLGELPATEAAIRKLIAKLAAKYRDLTFCYDAGPTGYGLYRLLKSFGHECLVVAPSLVPKKAGDRVKTNRRDAVSLAKLLRAGELTSWATLQQQVFFEATSTSTHWLQLAAKARRVGQFDRRSILCSTLSASRTCEPWLSRWQSIYLFVFMAPSRNKISRPR